MATFEENSGLRENLEEFAQELDPRHRAGLYNFARMVFCMGGMNGPGPTRKIPSDCDEWLRYFERKGQEYIAEVRKTDKATPAEPSSPE